MEINLSVLNRSYHLLKDSRQRWIITFSITGFVWMFLFGFGVYEFDYFSAFKRLYITGIYASACWISMVIHFFIIQESFINRLSVGNTILLVLSMMGMTGAFNFVITTLLFHWEPFSLMVFLKNQLNVLAIGIIIAPFLILFHNNYADISVCKGKAGIGYKGSDLYSIC